MATSLKPRVFVDTNVLYSALHSQSGPPAQILRLHADRRLQVVVSAQVLAELVRNVRNKAPERLGLVRELIATGSLETALNPPKSAIEAVSPMVNWDDAPIVAATFDAGVDYFVTGDRRLADEIKRLNPPFRVTSPRELIQEITDD